VKRANTSKGSNHSFVPFAIDSKPKGNKVGLCKDNAESNMNQTNKKQIRKLLVRRDRLVVSSRLMTQIQWDSR
jgi:hypothetical protein